jgi:hypothetical protein
MVKFIIERAMYLMAAVTLSLNLQAQVDLEMLNLRMDNFEFECLCAEELSKEQKKHIKSVYLKPNWCDQNMLNTESLNNWLEGFDSLEILIFRDMPVDAIPDRVFELEHLEVFFAPPPGACADPLHCTDAARPLVAGVGPSYARPDL